MRAYELTKRALDIVGATVGLTLSAPAIAASALAVRFEDRGPVLFRQERVGLDGRPFEVLKLRTMIVDAHTQGAGYAVDKGDSRITRVGHLLRKTSIDELPQLINVLRGEMSLVGPRPLAVEGDAFVGPEQRRHLVKPGITGLWQVSGRAEQSWEDAVRLDLYYVENWSLATDLLILLRTVLALFRGN